MRPSRPLAVLLASLLTLLLAACDRSPPGPADGSPEAAIDAAVGHLRAGDFTRFVAATLPPAEVERLRANWRRAMAEEPASAEEAADFRASMAKLTRPDAVDQLMAEFEPQLVQFERETAPNMPLVVGMGRGLVLSGIQESRELTPEQKAQATAMVDALGDWISNTPFSDRARVRAALTHVVDSARALGVSELDQLRALSFDEALVKGGVAWQGLVKALAVYGLSIDEMLASTHAETLSVEGDRATVRVHSRFLGKALSTDVEMLRVDGRWYSKPLIDEIAARSAGSEAAKAG